MSPPVPVPSKAAIHAMRGLAFGSSCAIGVIVEDRRRRINTLKAAVHNKQKLQSSRHYHHSAADEFDPLPPDASSLDPDDTVRWQFVPAQADHLHTPTRSGKRPAAGKHGDCAQKDAQDKQPPASEQAPCSIQATARPLSAAEPETSPVSSTTPSESNPAPSSTKNETLDRQAPHPETRAGHQLPFPAAKFVAGRSSASAWGIGTFQGIQQQRTRKSHSLVEVQEVQRLVRESRFDEAQRLLVDHPDWQVVVQNTGNKWLELSVRLCEEQQKAGKNADALRILERAVDSKTLSDDLFFRHNPLLIIEKLLFIAESGTVDRARMAYAKYKKILWSPHFEHYRSQRSAMEAVAKRFLQQSITLFGANEFESLYPALVSKLANPTSLLNWIVGILAERQESKRVIRCFTAHFAQCRFAESSDLERVMGAVTEAVESTHGYRTRDICKVLAGLNARGNSLRSRWLRSFLYSAWNGKQDFDHVFNVYKFMVKVNLPSAVEHPQLLYRALIDLALQAGKEEEAASFHEEFLSRHPNAATDIPTRGYFARTKALKGDWEGVQADFAAMAIAVKSGAKGTGEVSLYNAAFAGVLKPFADTHTAHETVEFMIRYMDELGVDISPPVVALVSKKLGQARDMTGFISWIQYCFDKGFGLTPKFCNPILHNATRYWKLGYPDLEALADAFRNLSPDALDEVSARIMNQAAVASKLRPSQKRYENNPAAFAGKSENKRDVYEAMNTALDRSRPLHALNVYKKAMEAGMPFSSHCFKLALECSVHRAGPGLRHGQQLIKYAHSKGHDVSSAISVWIKAFMERQSSESWQAIQLVSDLMKEFEDMGIEMDASALTVVAELCASCGRHEKALSLCEMARVKLGTANSCFSRKAFTVLLRVYWQTTDLEGVKRLLKDVEKSEFATETATINTIRAARKQVAKAARAAPSYSLKFTPMTDLLEEWTARLVWMRTQQNEDLGQLRQHLGAMLGSSKTTRAPDAARQSSRLRALSEPGLSTHCAGQDGGREEEQPRRRRTQWALFA